jgi:hypothetical protein
MGMAGIGAYVNLGDKINLGIEWTLHGVNSDKLDVTRGGFKYDAYSMLSVNITYNFNKRNPGKEPDTNQNKIFVPVYIQPQKTEPKPARPDTLVVLAENDTTLTDTITDGFDFPAGEDAEDIPANLRGPGITFGVQIFALRNDKYTALEVREKYSIDQEVYKDISDGWYAFSVGSFTNYEEAKTLKSQMRKQGFKGAFITRYDNGVRVQAHGRK